MIKRMWQLNLWSSHCRASTIDTDWLVTPDGDRGQCIWMWSLRKARLWKMICAKRPWALPGLYDVRVVARILMKVKIAPKCLQVLPRRRAESFLLSYLPVTSHAQLSHVTITHLQHCPITRLISKITSCLVYGRGYGLWTTFVVVATRYFLMHGGSRCSQDTTLRLNPFTVIGWRLADTNSILRCFIRRFV